MLFLCIIQYFSPYKLCGSFDNSGKAGQLSTYLYEMAGCAPCRPPIFVNPPVQSTLSIPTAGREVLINEQTSDITDMKSTHGSVSFKHSVATLYI